MEADRLIRNAEISDWMKGLKDSDIESGGWSDLHIRGARLTLQAMAISEEPYTGADLCHIFESSDARRTLKESISADVHTLTAIDPVIWRELSQRAATLIDKSE